MRASDCASRWKRSRTLSTVTRPSRRNFSATGRLSSRSMPRCTVETALPEEQVVDLFRKFPVGRDPAGEAFADDLLQPGPCVGEVVLHLLLAEADLAADRGVGRVGGVRRPEPVIRLIDLGGDGAVLG